MSIVVRNFEAGSNLKLISKTLKAVAHSTPPSAYVCVGDTIDTEEPDFLKGHGTALVDGRLIATLCGVVQRVDKLIYVQPVKSRYSPEVGDVVVGRVTEIAGKRWKVDLNSRQEAGLLISAVNLPGGVQRRRNAEDELNMRSMFREGDLISAEVQGKNQDGGIQLHTRSIKFGKLSGGQLVVVQPRLVKKQRFHFTTLKGLDVDIIAGLNGLIWVSPHIPRGEDGAPLQQQQQQQQQQPSAAATHLHQQQPSTAAAAAGGDPAAIAAAAAAAGGPSKQQREAVVRVAGAIRALAALMLQVYPDSIVEAYTASIEAGVAVAGMSERSFMAVLAQRELAAVGDFGVNNANEQKVSQMVAAWGVDGVMALGDDNYFVGSSTTIDANVGKYYGSFIYPYKGTYGSGSPTGTNRFWPIPGNHDWGNTCGDYKTGCSSSCATGSLTPYFNYMPVGGKAYYRQVLANGLIELFALDSDCNQPAGTTSSSVQGQWLQQALAASTATWKLVMLHHSPFSSSTSHGTNPRLQWPFEHWGAHAVFSAHDHLYERILKNQGFPYFVNGAGGQSLNSFSATPVSGSAVRYSSVQGAQLLTIDANTADVAYYAATNATNAYASLIDCYRLTKSTSGGISYSSCAGAAPPPPPQQQSLLTGAAADNTAGTANRVAWRYTSTTAANNIDPNWATTSFADGGWQLGATRLGYGPDFVYATTLPAASTGLLHHWFRVHVCLPSPVPAALAAVKLKVLSDNTAEVFINGVKAYTDPVADHEPMYWNTAVDIRPGFKAGANAIAVHVTNTAGSSDAAMDLDITYAGATPLTGITVATSAAGCGAPPPQAFSLLTGTTADDAAGTANRVSWRYTSTTAANNIDPNWATTSFGDGGWKLGATRLGYGPDFVYATTLPASSTGLLHHWFRLHVCLPSPVPAALAAVKLKVLSDNTAEVFINGIKAYTDPVADHEPKYWNTVVDISPGFTAGFNVIAVHVTNTAGSSDAAMDLDIMYTSSSPLTGTAVSTSGCVCSTTCASG